MICAKPGSELPRLLVGETVYALVEQDTAKVFAVGLSYNRVVREMMSSPHNQFLDIQEVKWVG